MYSFFGFFLKHIFQIYGWVLGGERLQVMVYLRSGGLMAWRSWPILTDLGGNLASGKLLNELSRNSDWSTSMVNNVLDWTLPYKVLKYPPSLDLSAQLSAGWANEGAQRQALFGHYFVNMTFFLARGEA